MPAPLFMHQSDKLNRASCRKMPGVRTWMLALVLMLTGASGAQTAYAQLTITPITWNVLGLDSNRVNDGPNVFPVGARICNTGGTTLNNVVASFIWDSSNTYINLTEGSTLSTRLLAPGACVNNFFNVTVTRNSAAYDTARRFHITATADGTGTVSTPTPRELYVEHLVSQARNDSPRRLRTVGSFSASLQHHFSGAECEHDLHNPGRRDQRQSLRRRLRLE
jgi:hypothetical protein